MENDPGFIVGVVSAVLFCGIVGAAAVMLIYRRLSATFRGVEDGTTSVIGKVVALLEKAAADLAETGDERL